MKNRQGYERFLTLAQFSQEIIEPHTNSEMAELHADTLISLASAYNHLGERDFGLRYSQWHFTQRLAAEDAKNPAHRHGISRAMAHTEMVTAWINNGEYQKAIESALIGRGILE